MWTAYPFWEIKNVIIFPEPFFILFKEDFPGLLPLVRHYVNASGGSKETIALVHQYLNLLECRASGERCFFLVLLYPFINLIICRPLKRDVLK